MALTALHHAIVEQDRFILSSADRAAVARAILAREACASLETELRSCNHAEVLRTALPIPIGGGWEEGTWQGLTHTYIYIELYI